MPLEKEFVEIEQLIQKYEAHNTDISAKGVDWHLDHMLKVILQVSKALKNSDPSEYKASFNFLRNVIFITKTIPRGKARSPKSVIPPDAISKDDLVHQLELAKKSMLLIENLDAKSNFKHPYFNMLNLKQTLKFLKIHTVHHLKICRDIIK
tara:strand:+ start:196252 stop:196704 length:453 start_codon:yes stop_codon:yes gene_type:complete